LANESAITTPRRTSCSSPQRISGSIGPNTIRWVGANRSINASTGAGFWSGLVSAPITVTPLSSVSQ
jgi:hypothetical protein